MPTNRKKLSHNCNTDVKSGQWCQQRLHLTATTETYFSSFLIQEPNSQVSKSHLHSKKLGKNTHKNVENKYNLPKKIQLVESYKKCTHI